MTHLYIVVEGETEETFVRELLIPALPHLTIQPILLGGVSKYSLIRKDIEKLKSHQGAYITTMIDYYGLNKVTNFPKLQESMSITNFRNRCAFLEQALDADINWRNFIPNILLHEFEALLFSDVNTISLHTDIPMTDLTNILNHANNDPEKINNSPQTAPSKRLLTLYRQYRKELHGNIIALDVGLTSIEKNCQHFKAWLDKLRQIP